MGFVEEAPFLYGQIAVLGVSAQVWDEMIEKMHDTLADYGEACMNSTPPALDQIVDDLRFKRSLDYTRGAEQTDREYVAALLTQGGARHRKQSERTGGIPGRPIAHEEQEIDWDLYDPSDFDGATNDQPAN